MHAASTPLNKFMTDRSMGMDLVDRYLRVLRTQGSKEAKRLALIHAEPTPLNSFMKDEFMVGT